MAVPAPGEPRRDLIIERLIGTTPPEAPPRIVRLAGLVGDSPIEDHVRLYDSDHLGHYIEVPRADVLDVHPQDPTQVTVPPGTSLFVNEDAVIRCLEPGHERYLAGDLVDQLVGVAVAGSTPKCKWPRSTRY
jgi:hypothetical protein